MACQGAEGSHFIGSNAQVEGCNRIMQSMHPLSIFLQDAALSKVWWLHRPDKAFFEPSAAEL